MVNCPLCIISYTYNHGSYIKDTMEGFCIQHTEFPFAAIIVDDASTDNTSEVIKSYLNQNFLMTDSERWETEDANFVVAQHRENQNCFFCVVFLKYNFYQFSKSKLPLMADFMTEAKYIAFCEGDDYWIAPNKLYRQVEYMERNQEYGLAYTDVKGYRQSNSEFFSMNLQGKSGYIYKDLVSDKINIWTLTVLIRRDLYSTRPQIDSNYYFCGDLLLFLHYTSKTKVYFLPEITAVYRILLESASHSQSKRTKSIFKAKVCRTRLYYIENGPLLEKSLRRVLVKKYMIGQLPYCFYYYDWDSFKKCKILFTPFFIPHKTGKYFFIYVLYRFCQIKPFFYLVCTITNKWGYK